MKLARFVFCQERQIEIDGPSQCRYRVFLNIDSSMLKRYCSQRLWQIHVRLPTWAFFSVPGTFTVAPVRVSRWLRAVRRHLSGRFGNVVYQVIQIVSYRIHQRHAQFQPVGWVYGPVAQLHIQVPPGIGPGSQHLPGTLLSSSPPPVRVADASLYICAQ